MENFDTELNFHTKEAEEIVLKYLPKTKQHLETITDAMNYSVRVGGKRLRPILMLESYRAFGGKDKVIEPFMAAIEFIHTYSLVHDDLPAMDNDELRRGKPTTWKVYGNGMGTLAGDALLNYAFETMLSAEAGSDSVSALNTIKAVRILAEKAGINGMIGGQCLDVEKEGTVISKEEIEFIHRNKTCALLEAPLMIGAILSGNATDEEIKTLEECGYSLGMAFQIRDDILDVISSTEELGKPVGSDEKNEKNTYVSIYGLETSEQLVEEYSHRAIELFESLDRPNPFLQELMLSLMNRRK